MKKKIVLGTKLSLNKEKLVQLNEQQLAHLLGGRMAATTNYTAGGNGICSTVNTSCCSSTISGCCS